MKKLYYSLLCILVATFAAQAQVSPRPLTFDDIESWNRITEQAVSNDGKWIVYKTEPWKGDSRLYIYDSMGNRQEQFDCGSSASFTFDSRHLLFRISPASDTVRELKLKKAKKDEMPVDMLVIYDLANKKMRKIPSIRKFEIPSKWSGWIAYQVDPVTAGQEIKADTSGTVGRAAKKRAENAKNGFTLNLLALAASDSLSFPGVTWFGFAEEGRVLAMVSKGDDEDFKAGLYHYDLVEKRLSQVLIGEGDVKQVALFKDGKRLAFLFDPEEKPAVKGYSLYKWQGSAAEKIVSAGNKALPEGWKVSENGQVRFGKEGNRIFFGTAPVMPEKDTMRLEDEYPNVDIWHGTEGKLHTVQVLERDNDLRASYMAVYDTRSGLAMQAETPAVPSSRLIAEGSSDNILLMSNEPYALQSMWESSPLHYDIYLLNMKSGQKRMIKKDIRASFMASPGGKYLYWYNYSDSSWYTYGIADGAENRVTTPDIIQCADEINDVPNFPSPYMLSGWLQNDEAMLVSDRYDIWLVDPQGRKAPVNLTVNGRNTLTSYNMIRFDREKQFIDPREPQFLTGFNERTKESGYYSWNARRANAPVLLAGGKYRFSRPVKAQDAETVLFTKETFNDFPELLVSDLSFSDPVRISNANPRQKEFIWGDAELVEWLSLDGQLLQGLVYKPSDFDPAKKYPLIVNFYERSSDGLYDYRMPELHRSTVDYHYYTSNGYVVFNPDIVYENGYPGESAYNCVMPGITALIAEGFIDRNRIGAQGHSWGGYQVAYLATRTDLFAAIESGAPVVNMFSAYGGIRWWSGLNRSFQYEHQQSRIGASIWESPLRYVENSPLFTLDKVTTPILIMANDQDGHVPWYQGIEFFMALRRLQKPVWMLNYTGEPHWPQKMQNKKDFQIRMAQFFDHYLKGSPMPRWMKEGVPAIMKEYDLGYELMKQ